LRLLSREEKKRFLLRDEALQQGRSQREALRNIRLGRLSVKSACRHVVVIDDPVSRVGFTWSAASQSIRRITVAQARGMLLERGELASADLQRLEGLPEEEV